jgi:hypothetical protein
VTVPWADEETLIVNVLAFLEGDLWVASSTQPVVDLLDDDFVSEGEVTAWERRLGIVVPKGE